VRLATDATNQTPSQSGDERRSRYSGSRSTRYGTRHPMRSQPFNAMTVASRRNPQHRGGECIIGPSSRDVTRRMIVLSLAVLVCIAAVCVWSGRGPRTRELLREVYSPTFDTVPPMAPLGETIAELRGIWRRGRPELSRAIAAGPGRRVVDRVARALAVAVDFSGRRTGRNVDLV
jgi:hypothetical protein